MYKSLSVQRNNKLGNTQDISVNNSANNLQFAKLWIHLLLTKTTASTLQRKSTITYKGKLVTI